MTDAELRAKVQRRADESTWHRVAMSVNLILRVISATASIAIFLMIAFLGYGFLLIEPQFAIMEPVKVLTPTVRAGTPMAIELSPCHGDLIYEIGQTTWWQRLDSEVSYQQFVIRDERVPQDRLRPGECFTTQVLRDVPSGLQPGTYIFRATVVPRALFAGYPFSQRAIDYRTEPIEVVR